MKPFFRRCRPLTSWFMVAIGWVTLSCPALAALGGDVTSVAADQAHMKASLEVKPSEGYQIHALRAPGGTVVNEYVSAGRVFAVAWHGPFFPEMQQILGSYFQQYSAALQARKRVYGHHPLDLEQPGLVVQSGGHMRAFMGRAYIPEMLPAGLKAEQIK
jgi:Protein of unknown function (DUF2844)